MKKRLIYGILAIALIAVSIYGMITINEKQQITVIHTVSYSNAVVFNTIEHNPGVINRKFILDPAKHVEALLAEENNSPVVSVTPFANALIASNHNSHLRVIAGSGLNGLSLIARQAVDASGLKGKKIGTSRGDSLEVFVVEYMSSNGISPQEYKLVYFNDPFEAIEAIKKGSIDAVTHVEPFATNLVAEQGMRRLVTSQELWGDHPDAVILTTESVLTKYGKELAWLVSTLQQEEKMIEDNPKETAARLASTFYQMPAEKLERILQRQEPEIDIRKYVQFFHDRYKTLEQIKYVEGAFPTNLFDFSLIK